MPQESWLIVGLGNPGDTYENTWHNAGYQVLDHLAQRLSLSFKRSRFKSRVAQTHLAGRRCFLMKPTTYMNVSGQAVQAFLRYHRLSLDHCLVVYDDIDLPMGSLRIRPSGGPGTHNGMRSIVASLQSDLFPRIRLGIGPKPQDMELAAYVLSNIQPPMKEDWDKLIERAADAVLTIPEHGLQEAMRRHHGSNGSLKP